MSANRTTFMSPGPGWEAAEVGGAMASKIR
jgi:hypothetical protein